MVDLGAAGVDPDPDQWRDGTDYSHYSRAFEDVLLPEAPYVDEDALVDARRSVLDYAHHVLAQGYNAVTVPGFLDYVTFAEVPEVYADDPAYVARAEAVRDAFGPIWQELDDLGLDVYLRTDMLVLSTPLERYLDRPVRPRPRPTPGSGTSTRPRSTRSTASCRSSRGSC